MIPRLLRTAVFVSVLLAAKPLSSQAPGFSTGPWNRVDTEHFTFLYPDELSDWTISLAERMEAVFAAVGALVRYTPEDRVTVIVDDPANVSNGAMYAGPLLYLWPTPPDPRSTIGENRGWPEMLAVHEFAHAAHLARPSRNPLRRFLTSLLPIPVTDMMLSAPRWLIEGYATFIEGRVTGSGRPHGVWRPAVLRSWALEGQLPTYAAVNGSGGYFGGSMAYLMGSAFLDWLIEQESGNEEVLVDLWRRMTSRRRRSFNSAFDGVFGASPAELYGLFQVSVIENALAVRDAVREAGGTVDGTLFQRLNWSTGDPAVSPDGKHLAVALRSRNRPSRLVVMSTTPDTLTDDEKRRQAEIYETDPEDVAPVSRRPRAQKPLATLHANLGREYAKPAFMPDGEGILVVRSDLVENSRSRPDLFIWRWRDGDVRRITRGEAIREAHPAPDGSWAAGVRCLNGRCDIVRIELATGAVTTLAPGGLRRPYYHPRVSPDGSAIVASVQHDGRWRLVKMDVDGSNERFIGPADEAARFDAEFLNAGDSLVVTSTRGGIHNIELLDVRTGRVQTVTRMVSAAVAPAPTPDGDVFFLALHSRGWDLRRIATIAAPAVSVVFTDPGLSPATAAPAETYGALARAELGQIRGYGLGPRHIMPLPLFDQSVSGWSAGLSLRSTDPIGKFTWQVRGMHGSDGGWRGGAAEVQWRGFRPSVRIQGFAVDGPLSSDAGGTTDGLDNARNEDYIGAAALFEHRRINLGSVHRFLVGGSAGRLDANRNRTLGVAEYELGLLQARGNRRLAESMKLHVSGGRTGDLNWTRWRISGSVSLRLGDLGMGITGLCAGTNAPDHSGERLVVGGTDPLLFDPAISSFRLAMPALKAGGLQGDLVRTVKTELHSGLPFTTFFWTGDAVDDGQGWLRLAGIEFDESLPEMSYLRLPAVRLRLGVARMIGEPDNGNWRAWGTLSYRP